MQDFFKLFNNAKTDKENIARKMALILGVIDQDDQFAELREMPMFSQTRRLYDRALDTLGRQGTTDLRKNVQRLHVEVDAVLDLIQQYITRKVITDVPMAHELSLIHI